MVQGCAGMSGLVLACAGMVLACVGMFGNVQSCARLFCHLGVIITHPAFALQLAEFCHLGEARLLNIGGFPGAS